MFNFFKKQNVVTDISWLGIDIHSHILPGIDDGVQDIEQSVTYIKVLQELGFEKLFFTPHTFPELYPNSPETILPAFESVKSELRIAGNEISIGAASEYMIDYNFNTKSDFLTLPGNHLLIEMSYLSETPNIEQIIFDLQIRGFIIILAHPERYNFYHKSVERYNRLKEMGCLFQLNILSITGYYGKEVKNAADFLLKQKLYDLAATDLHHDKHLNLLSNIIKSGKLYSSIGNYEFQNKLLFG